MNSIFQQIPFLVEKLPQGAKISAQLSIAIQLSNIFPLIFVFFTERTQSSINEQDNLLGTKNAQKTEFRVPVSIFSLGMIVSVSYIIFWEALDSNPLAASWMILILAFFSGAVGSLSNVSCWPLVSIWAPEMIATFSVGAGCSSVIPSILAAIQFGSSREIGFSFSAFFICITVVMGIALASLLWLSRRFQDSLIERKDSSDILQHVNFTIIWSLVLQLAACFEYFLVLGMSASLVNGFKHRESILSFFLAFGVSIGALSRLACSWVLKYVDSAYISVIIQVCVAIQTVFFILETVFFPSYGLIPVPWLLISIHSFFSACFGCANTLLYMTSSMYHDSRKTARWLGYAEQIGAFLGALMAFVISSYFLF